MGFSLVFLFLIILIFNVLRRLEFLGCARIASAVLKVGAARIKGVFSEIPQLTPEEERLLKEQNPFGWKQETKPVVDEDRMDGVESDGTDSAAGGAGAGAGGAGVGAGATVAA